MKKLTQRLVDLNLYTSKMIELLTGERVEKPVVYIGDVSPVRQKIHEGRPFSIEGDGRRTAVAYVLNELGTVYNVCATKKDPRIPYMWNIIYERAPEDSTLRRAIFMVKKNGDVKLTSKPDNITFRRLKGVDLPRRGAEILTYDARFGVFLRGYTDKPPGDVASYIFRKYGKNSTNCRVLYTYYKMSNTPYGTEYLRKFYGRR